VTTTEEVFERIFERGRTKIATTDSPDWIHLSGISATACALYMKIAMHVNVRRGDQEAYPSLESLALMMGLGRGDRLSKYLKELESIDAITRRRVGAGGPGNRARNVYRVNETPPPDYAGPLNIAEWYERNSAEVSRRLERNANRVDTSRKSAPEDEADTSDVTHEDGIQDVAHESGLRVPRDGGLPVTHVSGVEQPIRGNTPEGNNSGKTSSYRTDSGETDAAQLALDADGLPPAPPPPPPAAQVAAKCARDWITHWTREGAQIVTRRGVDPFVLLRNLLLPFAEAGYSETVIKNGLLRVNRSVPTPDALSSKCREYIEDKGKTGRPAPAGVAAQARRANAAINAVWGEDEDAA
jgi:hypothetical protein